MKITRGTTPRIVINVKSDMDLSSIKVIWVYISQNSRVVLNKELPDVMIDNDNRTITMTLSQNDTLGLKVGDGIFQIRFLMNDNTALASKPCKIGIEEIYKDGVIS